MIMYNDTTTENVYNGPVNTNECVMRLSRLDANNLMPLGYDHRSDSWVFSTFDTTRSASEHIVLYRKAKRLPLTLESLPAITGLKQAALLDGHVFVPFAENGQLVVYRYDLFGKLTQRKAMHIPGVNIEDIYGEDRLAVARNGWVAANLGHKLYVFDEEGRVITTIAGGGEPKISPDGRMLAYREKDYRNVIILDIHTKRHRVISVWPQPNARLWDMLVYPSCFQLDWRNQWLLCAYEQGMSGGWIIYAADISSSIPHWKKLPIQADWWKWVVIDKAPRSSCGRD